MKLLELYFIFVRLSLFCVGGGYSMLPVLRAELVEKRKWLTPEELADCYAIGQCTPGVIAVNTATFVGIKRCGVVGGVVATLGIVTPSFVIMTLLGALYNYAVEFVQSAAFVRVLGGVKAAVAAYTIYACVGIIRTGVKTAAGVAIFAAAAAAVTLGVSPAIVVIGAVVCGAAYYVWCRVTHR